MTVCTDQTEADVAARFVKKRLRQKRRVPRAYIPIFFGVWSERMGAFKHAIEVTAKIRKVSPGFLLAQLAYSALDQWGELPDKAKGCLEDYYLTQMRREKP